MRCLRSGGESMLGISLTAFLCFIVFTQVAEGKVSCYVCHWHSPQYGSTNMTDTCSHYNFDPAYAVTIECDGGCEAVSIRRAKNGNIVNFYKNCLSSKTSSSHLENKCTTTEDKNMQHITTCECTSDFCNAVGRLEVNMRNLLWPILCLLYCMKGNLFPLVLWNVVNI